MSVKLKKRHGAWWVFINYHGKRKAKKVGTRQAGERVKREIEARLSSMEQRIQEMLAPLYQEMPKPRFLPSYAGLQVDPGGNLWVRQYSSEADPVFVWTVFDPSGRMLGDVQFPPGLVVFEVGRDYVLGRWRDETDIEFVRLYPLIKP